MLACIMNAAICGGSIVTILALIYLFLITAVYNWNAILYDRRHVEYATKIIAMLILGSIVLLGDHNGHIGVMQGLFLTALFCSLVADLFSTFAGLRFLETGLALSAVALMCYVAGMSLVLPTFWSRLLIAPLAAIGFAQVYFFRNGALKKGFMHARVPVAVYGCVLTVFLFTGLSGLFRADWLYSWNWIKYLLLASGTVLFYLSDSLLGYGWFCCEERSMTNRVWAMLLYHIGQLLLVLGCVVEMSGFY